jgi:hypothetical protein
MFIFLSPTTPHKERKKISKVKEEKMLHFLIIDFFQTRCQKKPMLNVSESR